MRPPQQALGEACVGDEERCEVGDHEEEDQAGDDAGFRREFVAFALKPDGPDDEAADEEAGNRDGAGDGEGCGEIEVEAAEDSLGIEKAEAQADRHVIQGDEGEGKEAPEDKGVRQAW